MKKLNFLILFLTITTLAGCEMPGQKYQIIWKNYDGSILEEDVDVIKGEIPSYDGITPKRPNDTQYSYTFTGWSPEITPVIGNKTYVAQFESSINSYTITWEVEGTIITELYNYGDTPSFKKGTPTKESSPQFSYTFTGWSPEITPVTGNKTYVAQFESVMNTYTIKWQNYDGSLIEMDSNVPYGTMPSFDGATPQRPNDNQYSYTFMGWTPSLELVSKDATYVATFSSNVLTLLEFELSDNGNFYIVTGIGTETNKKVIIPSQFKGIPVQEIGDYAFSGCEYITNIEIPETIVKIGDYAFEDCHRLSEIKIPNNVQNYGANILVGCKSIKKIEIPYLTSNIYELFGDAISYDTFYNNIPYKEGYKSVTFASSSYQKVVDVIYDMFGNYKEIYETYFKGTYYYCPSLLKEIKVDSGSISDKAFYKFESAYIYLGENITSIGNQAFESAEILNDIIIPNGVESIGSRAFSYFNQESLIIPNTITYFGKEVFYFASFTNVFYTGSMKEWCEISFENFYSNPMHPASKFHMLDKNNEWYEVTKIEIPEGIPKIGNSQFAGFNNLVEVIIPNSVTSIGNYAFYGCNSLHHIIIPVSVTSIGEEAFYSCSALTTITIPDSVTSIGSFAFNYCSQLIIYCESPSYLSGWRPLGDYGTPVYLGVNENTFIKQNGLEFVIENGEAVVTRYIGNNSEVVIPSTIEIKGLTYVVSRIGNLAFSNSASLTSIIIPNTITSIGKSAFSGCKSLSSIIIPSSVTEIEMLAFCNCDSLSTIVIPNSVSILGARVFASCDSLTVFCEATSIPDYWNSTWKGEFEGRYYMGGKWEYDPNGKPVPIE